MHKTIYSYPTYVRISYILPHPHSQCHPYFHLVSYISIELTCSVLYFTIGGFHLPKIQYADMIWDNFLRLSLIFDLPKYKPKEVFNSTPGKDIVSFYRLRLERMLLLLRRCAGYLSISNLFILSCRQLQLTFEMDQLGLTSESVSNIYILFYIVFTPSSPVPSITSTKTTYTGLDKWTMTNAQSV